MAQRCALIVDDSKTARQLLGQMLASNDVRVETAESAEEALEFLSRSRPDVIFMDHMMPGMDGFQAVRAIKNNPATATIPIMMYTSQEGEVYVGQARALGAVGVLPKQIKPAEVSEVLKSLRLLDAGGPANAATQESSPQASAASLQRYAADVATDLNSRDWTDLHRWLQEMFEHLGKDLRTDIETSVARLLREHETALVSPSRRRLRPGAVLTAVLTVALAGLAALFFWLHLDTQRKWRAAVDQNASLMAALTSRRSTASADAGNTVRSLDAERDALVDRYQGFLSALEWGVNQATTYPPDHTPLGDELLETLSGLIQQLTRLGFSGTVRVDSFVGNFCYVSASGDSFVLAADDLPAERCDRVGLPPGEARTAAARQSVGFANFVASHSAATGIRVEVEPHGDGLPLAAYPLSTQGITAGDWNKIALQNNRVSIRIIPDHPPGT